MEVITKMINLLIGVAGVILILVGVAYDNDFKMYFFVGGIVLFIIAMFMRFLAMVYYGK